jgi:hypothetical protein
VANNGDVKIRGSKWLQYTSTDNTWYPIRDLKPMVWFKFDDFYTFSNNTVVTGNNYSFSNAGFQQLPLKTIIASRVAVPTVTVDGTTSTIVCAGHTLVVGDIICNSATSNGFTANATYYVISIVAGVSFTLSTTFTTANTLIIPTTTPASTISTLYKKQGIDMAASSTVTEGYNSVSFLHGNHVVGSYLNSTMIEDWLLTSWTLHFNIRLNTTGQPYPAGAQPANRYIFSTYDGGGSNLRLYFSGTSLTLNLNGNIVTIPVDGFSANSSTPFTIIAKYDGTTLNLKYIYNTTVPATYKESITISGQTLSVSTSTGYINIGADSSGANCLSKLFIDSMRIYDRSLSDEEESVLYNYARGNQFSCFIPTYQYFDLYRWQMDEASQSYPMNSIGYANTLTPDNGTTNLKRMNEGTGVLVGQTEDGIKCYKFVESSKGYCISTINMAAVTSSVSLSIGFWFKDTSASQVKRRWLTNTAVNAGIGLTWWNFGQSETGANVLRLNVNNVESLITTTNWRNVWNYWTLVFDGYTNITSVYKNGVFIGSVASAIFDPAAGFYAGGRNTTLDTEYINGFMRDVRVVSYKMNQGEMKLTYNEGKPLRI